MSDSYNAWNERRWARQAAERAEDESMRQPESTVRHRTVEKRYQLPISDAELVRRIDDRIDADLEPLVAAIGVFETAAEKAILDLYDRIRKLECENGELRRSGGNVEAIRKTAMSRREWTADHQVLAELPTMEIAMSLVLFWSSSIEGERRSIRCMDLLRQQRRWRGKWAALIWPTSCKVCCRKEEEIKGQS
jgi:hypothetical protein